IYGCGYRLSQWLCRPCFVVAVSTVSCCFSSLKAEFVGDLFVGTSLAEEAAGDQGYVLVTASPTSKTRGIA
ncbi:MAG: hypothetical protein ABJ360_26070, partial [Roseobacter sp.]